MKSGPPPLPQKGIPPAPTPGVLDDVEPDERPDKPRWADTLRPVVQTWQKMPTPGKIGIACGGLLFVLTMCCGGFASLGSRFADGGGSPFDGEHRRSGGGGGTQTSSTRGGGTRGKVKAQEGPTQSELDQLNFDEIVARLGRPSETYRARRKANMKLAIWPTGDDKYITVTYLEAIDGRSPTLIMTRSVDRPRYVVDNQKKILDNQ